MNEKTAINNLEDALMRLEWIAQTFLALDNALRSGADLCSMSLYFPTLTLTEKIEEAQKIFNELKKRERC